VLVVEREWLREGGRSPAGMPAKLGMDGFGCPGLAIRACGILARGWRR
jgi:hypothetical protein